MSKPSGLELLRRVSDICWRALVVAASVALMLWLLQQVWSAVLSVVAAGMLAIGLSPLVRGLCRRGVPRLLATWLVFLGIVSLVAGIVVLSTASVSGDVKQLGSSLDQSITEVKDWATGPPLEIDAETFDEAVEEVRTQVERLAGRRQLLTVARMAVTVVTGALLSLVLLFFFLKDGPSMAAWSLGLLPVARRETVVRVARRARQALEGYLRGTALIGALEATFIGVLLAVLGVSQFLPLAVITFFAAFFPIVGAIVAGMAAVLVTLVEGSPTRALIAAVAIVALQQIDGDILQPLVMSNAVRLHPVVVLLALSAGGLVAGITGAFLAVPLTAVIAASANELRHIRDEAALELPDGAMRPP